MLLTVWCVAVVLGSLLVVWRLQGFVLRGLRLVGWLQRRLLWKRGLKRSLGLMGRLQGGLLRCRRLLWRL